jgi:hypothetical protein
MPMPMPMPMAMPMAWTTLLDSRDFDDWRGQVHQLLGPHACRNKAERGQTFRQRIRAATVGPVQLVALEGDGSFLLERIQQADRAVLWLPTTGVVEETVAGATITPEPGMGLWIRPSTALVGRIRGACSGVSIVLPVSLLQCNGASDYSPDPDAGPMLLDPFSRQRTDAMVRLLHCARDLVQAVGRGPATPSPELLLDSLIQHLQEWDLADPWSGEHISRAEQHCRDAEDWMLRHLDQPISVSDVAAGIHLSQRSMQISFRSQRDLTPLEAIQRLRERRRQQATVTGADAAGGAGDGCC